MGMRCDVRDTSGLVLPYIVAILTRGVAMRAGVALLPALLVARYRREERGKSFPFNGNE
jgi:hypothetical protein